MIVSIYDISRDLGSNSDQHSVGSNFNGNVWTSENVNFECQQGSQISNYQTCACQKYKVDRILESRAKCTGTSLELILGTYEKVVAETSENDFSGAIYKEPSKNIYLVSIHPKGRVWSIGKGKDIDDDTYARIDFETYDENQCPHSSMHNNTFHWEFLKSTTEQGHGIWETDPNFEVKCIECQETYFLCPESGNCVPHCDGQEDCDDGSDEMNCTSSLLLSGGIKIIPVNENGHNTEKVSSILYTLYKSI